MKKVCVLLVAIAFVFSSCDDYGKKVDINAKSEVYYKGDGVTEADAKNLGNLLLETSFFNTTDQKSVQLSKDSGTYFVRFVVDKAAYEQQKEEANTSFRLIQTLIGERVFSGGATKVILTDNKFEDMVRVGEATAEEKAMVQQMLTEGNAPAEAATDSTTATATPVSQQ